jgi:hypothetical protein
MCEPDKADAEPRVHRFGPGERVAWSAGPRRQPGEGVVAALLPPTVADGQPRYRVHEFVDGRPGETEIDMVQGVLYDVPRWAVEMPREERLQFHQGVTPPWDEEIESS